VAKEVEYDRDQEPDQTDHTTHGTHRKRPEEKRIELCVTVYHERARTAIKRSPRKNERRRNCNENWNHPKPPFLNHYIPPRVLSRTALTTIHTMEPKNTSTQSKKLAAKMLLSGEFPLAVDAKPKQLPPPSRKEHSITNKIGL